MRIQKSLLILLLVFLPITAQSETLLAPGNTKVAFTHSRTQADVAGDTFASYQGVGLNDHIFIALRGLTNDNNELLLDGTIVETVSNLNGFIRGTGLTSNNIDTFIVQFETGGCYSYLPGIGAVDAQTNQLQIELMGGANCTGAYATTGPLFFDYIGDITVDQAMALADYVKSQGQ